MAEYQHAIAAREQALAATYGVTPDTQAALQRARQTLSKHEQDPWRNIAALVIAPVLAGFTGWCAAQIGRHDHPVVLGVMREGRLLCRLLNTLYQIPAQEISVNRHCAMLAAFGCGDDEALVNWLARTRVQALTRAAAAKLLGVPVPGDPAALLDGAAAQALVRDNPDNWLAPARARAQELAARLLRHWRQRVPLERSVLLLDFACAGNIQRALRVVLAAHGDHAPLVGLNFLMTAGSVWAEQAGCVMHGFLAERGAPSSIATPYARTPELIEIFAAAPVGSLLDYRDDGAPLLSASFLRADQIHHIDQMQDIIIAASAHYQHALGTYLTAALARCVLGRLLTQPLPEEIAALADWPIDGGMDGTAQRPLAPKLRGDPATWPRDATAWPTASVLRNA